MENVDKNKIEKNIMTVKSVTAIMKNLFIDEQQNLSISMEDHSLLLLSIEVPFNLSDKVNVSNLKKHETIIKLSFSCLENGDY